LWSRGELQFTMPEQAPVVRKIRQPFWPGVDPEKVNVELEPQPFPATAFLVHNQWLPPPVVS
jgi:hypothetical protein